MYFSFFFNVIPVVFTIGSSVFVLTLQYAVFLPTTIHTLKQQQRGNPVNLPYAIFCPRFNSYQWVAVFFFHCSQFSCTVLCDFHMDVYDYLLPQKFRNSVDRDYCAMENKSGKCIVVLKNYCVLQVKI